MVDEALCPPLNVPAAVASIKARLDALDQAESSTQELLSSVPAAISAIYARLDAMDRATDLMHSDYTQVPTELDRRAIQLEQVFDSKIELLRTLYANLQKYADTRDIAIDRAVDNLKIHMLERIATIDMRFAERDLRFSQTGIDHQKAIDAALASVNSASEKNERAFTKQIDNLSDALNRSAESLGGRIGDLKDRLTRSEGTSNGATAGVTAVTGWIVAGIMTITAIVTTMVALYNVIHNHS
jgi:chromosome segregation ATPase